MGLVDAFRRLDAQPDPPCEGGKTIRWRCKFYDHCRTELAACWAFELYVRGGGSKGDRRNNRAPREVHRMEGDRPTRDRYQFIYKTADTAWGRA